MLIETSVDGESPSAALFTSVSRVCAVCTQQYSKYKCPRCAIQYCSLACYRNHGEACTETFYEESAHAALKANVTRPKQQIDMLRMLQRLEAAGEEGCDADAGSVDGEADGDDVDGGDSGAARTERLNQLLVQTHLDESLLTEDERREFRRLVADGSLGAQLQSSDAWWSRLEALSVVSVPTARDGKTGGGWRWCSPAVAAAATAAGAPEPPPTLPPLRSLTRRTPCERLRFNVLEVVCAYVYTWRLYCGELDEDVSGAAAALLGLSLVLSGEQSHTHASAAEALVSVACAAQAPTLATSAAFGAACLTDAHRILGAEGSTALALAGARALLGTAARACKSGEECGGSAKASGGPAPKDEEDVAEIKGGQLRAEEDGAEEESFRGGQWSSDALKQAKRKARFLEVWWASRPAAERRAALEDLRFGLKRELERMEAVRVAGAADGRRPSSGPQRSELVTDVS